MNKYFYTNRFMKYIIGNLSQEEASRNTQIPYTVGMMPLNF